MFSCVLYLSRKRTVGSKKAGFRVNDVVFFLAGSVFKNGWSKEGDIGGYPIPQYRKTKWQIPKYRFENRLNTDTAYFSHIYNRFRILMVASI